MQGEKQLRNFIFFGNENQIRKSTEEICETITALVNYALNPCYDTAYELVSESYDIANVVEGIAKFYGVCLIEAQQNKEIKNCRTERIRKQIPVGTKEEDRLTEYEKIRRG